MRIIYISDNYLGGVNSLNQNLMSNNPDKAIEQWVIPVDCEELDSPRATVEYQADRIIDFSYSKKDNVNAVLKRLRKLIPDEPGVLVLNDYLEMTMLDHYPVQQTVYQLIHDPYYVRLAEKFHHIVDVFITHNRNLYDELNAKLPADRRKDIFFLPHGVTIPTFYRNQTEQAASSRLRLLFLARVTESKGAFDLVDISSLLQKNGCDFEWTVIGRGPALPELKEKWNDSVPVQFLSPDTNREVLEIAATHDVFVLPTKFDGTPVSLLETMSVGLVPVMTDLPGGIHEIVQPEIGFALPMNDNPAFAAAITTLSRDRNLLATLGRQCRAKAERDFDVKKTTLKYFEKFAGYQALFKPKTLKYQPVGSRLDHPLIPSFITKTVRSLRN